MIVNGSSRPLVNGAAPTLPDVSGALGDLFQPISFGTVTKSIGTGFQVAEAVTTVNGLGTVQPFTERQLQILPEGQRAWTNLWCHTDPSVTLEVDSIVTYLGTPTRVMSVKDYSKYGYLEYRLVQDWQ